MSPRAATLSRTTRSTRSARPSRQAPRLTASGRLALAQRLETMRAELADLGPQLADPEMERRLDDRYDRLWQDAAALEGLLAEAGDASAETPGTVAVGSLVEVAFPGSGVERLRPVDPREATLDDERVSVDAPVSRAVLGRRAGDTVTVVTPRGTVTCTLLRVTDPDC